MKDVYSWNNVSGERWNKQKYESIVKDDKAIKYHGIMLQATISEVSRKLAYQWPPVAAPVLPDKRRLFME